MGHITTALCLEYITGLMFLTIWGAFRVMITFSIFLRFIGLCATLLLFGIAYAYLIARKPFPPHLTWASVLIGDLVTDFGMGAVILLLTEDLFLAGVPLMCHILTGGPMILGQITKHAIENGGDVIIEGIDGD